MKTTNCQVQIKFCPLHQRLTLPNSVFPGGWRDKQNGKGEWKMKKIATIVLLICIAAFAQENGSFTDSRDSKTYKTVKIGDQTWMAENLGYNANGLAKCYGEGNKVIVNWNVGISGIGPNYKTLSNAEIQANCDLYGRLYNWNTALNACPKGWHLPSNAEWQVLINFAGGEKVAGKNLKAISGWNKNGNGTDIYGFSALPGGVGDYYGGDAFKDIGDEGNWWSASELQAGTVYVRGISKDWEGMSGMDDYYDGRATDYLFSVRCLKD